MSKKFTTEEFIIRVNKKHNNKYDYFLVDYKNIMTKIKIICPKHGEFEQIPNDHLNGFGCSKCSNTYSPTTREFIEKVKKIHNNNKYDYSKVNYEKANEKVIIICPEHGEFEQIPDSHLRGRGCPKCVNKNVTTKEFIKKAKKIHGEKYNYSLVNYINNHLKIKILCPEHGIFEQIPNTHLNGCGCLKCTHNNILLNKKNFIMKAKIIHNNKYEYSLVEYKNAHTNIIIICPKHGEFKQTPSCHLNGHGCSICKESKGEKIIRNFLTKNNILFERQKTFNGCKGKRRKLAFDYYLPEKNILIEFDGKQHFEPVKRFGGEKVFKETKINDNIKNQFAKENNINLLRISYKDDIIKKLEEMIGAYTK